MRSPNGEMKAELKKGSWTHEEDEMLKAYINRYGIWNWSHMPRFAGLNRSGKSCRLRWMNYLKPNVKRGNFSQEEEEIILHYHSLLGNKKKDNEVKNYWHTHLKKRAYPNSMRETTKENDMNILSICEGNVVEKLVQDNHANNRFGSLGLQTSEDDSSSSNSSTTTQDHEVEFKDDYYDLCSPGTVKDLQCFWKQFCGSENLELEHISIDHPVFPYSYNEATSAYSFYNNDFDTI